jgi:hypothetical protein
MLHLTTSTVDCSLHQTQFRHVACHHRHSPKKIFHNNNPQWYSSPPLAHSVTITPSDLKQTSLIHAANISAFANYRHSAQVIYEVNVKWLLHLIALNDTRTHTHTHTHTLEDSPGRRIGPSHRHLPDKHTTLTRGRKLWLRQDLNQQPQHASGLRHTS